MICEGCGATVGDETDFSFSLCDECESEATGDSDVGYRCDMCEMEEATHSVSVKIGGTPLPVDVPVCDECKDEIEEKRTQDTDT